MMISGVFRDRTFFGQIFASVAVDLQWAFPRFAEAFDHIDVDRKRWNTCAIFCDRSTSGRRVIMFADVYRTLCFLSSVEHNTAARWNAPALPFCCGNRPSHTSKRDQSLAFGAIFPAIDHNAWKIFHAHAQFRLIRRVK